MGDKREKYEITATELKQNLGKYLATVEQFQEFVITRNGKKIARLTPYITDYAEYLAVRERARDFMYDRKKVSYEEFMAIYEKTDLRMEYIDGEIVLLASPSITHQELLGRLYLEFSEVFKGCSCQVFLSPFDVHFHKQGIDDPDVCQPDLLVICDLEGNVSERDRYLGTPTLVVEILSESTRSKDLVQKLNTYMLSGVEEYWIVDPKQKNIVIYVFESREIVHYQTYKGADTAASQVFAELKIALPGLSF